MKNCPGCEAVHDGHRWVPEPGEGLLLRVRREGADRKTCPGCLRLERGEVEGVVTLKGRFMGDHLDEIRNLVRRIARNGRRRNVAARVLREEVGGGAYVIETTDTHLAERIGKEVERAFKGALDMKWQEKDRFVRVVWQRE